MKNENQMSLELPGLENKFQQASHQMLEEVFNHYRSTGFPHLRYSQEESESEFRSLRTFDTTECWRDNNLLSCPVGVGLANSFHPHRYGVVCNEHRTALYVFGRDHLLKKAIAKCIRLSGGVNDAKMRSMLSIFEGVQVASNFPPGTAKAIYEKYVPDGGAVWDMSCGFGGRLLAALASNNIATYYGTEPSTKTFAGLQGMVKSITDWWQFPPLCDVELLCQGSEDEIPDWSVDLCFTSPPYWDTEKYAREDSQSFLRYSNRTDWINQFIGGTIRNCKKILKPDGLIAVNIANVNTFRNLEDKFVEKCKQMGLTLLETKKVVFQTMPGQGKRNKSETNAGERTEPLFIFKDLGKA